MFLDIDLFGDVFTIQFDEIGMKTDSLHSIFDIFMYSNFSALRLM